MKSFFKKYLPFARASFMDFIAYKTTIFIWLFIDVLSILLTVFVWTAVYNSHASSTGVDLYSVVLNGFTYKEIVSYNIIIFIFSFSVFGGGTSDTISNEIKDGTIAVQLIKPINYRNRFIFSYIGNLISANLIIGIPLLSVSYIVLSVIGFIPFNGILDLFCRLVILILFEIIACILNDSFNFIFGILAFYTNASFGLFQIKNAVQGFLSGTLIPMSFIASSSILWIKGLGTILDYSPFVYMAQYPTYLVIGRITPLHALASLGIAILWLFAFELIGRLAYAHATKKLIIQGG